MSDTTHPAPQIKGSKSRTKWGSTLLTLFTTAIMLWLGLSPQIDIWVSNLFYHQETQTFIWQNHSLAIAVHHLIRPFALTSGVILLILIPLALTIRKLNKRHLARPLAFVLLALILGPGLLTNTLIKDNSGRARPDETTLYGGQDTITPALQISTACSHNCSFIAGDPSVGFWLVTFAILANTHRRKKLIITTGIAAGTALGILRLAMGAHFLSDVLFSAAINLGFFALLYQLMFQPQKFRKSS